MIYLRALLSLSHWQPVYNLPFQTHQALRVAGHTATVWSNVRPPMSGSCVGHDEDLGLNVTFVERLA